MKNKDDVLEFLLKFIEKQLAEIISRIDAISARIKKLEDDSLKSQSKREVIVHIIQKWQFWVLVIIVISAIDLQEIVKIIKGVM